MPGRITRRHHSQPPTWKFFDASCRSPGKALAPAMTLNRMYHCVPRIISGVSQMSGLPCEIDRVSTNHGRRTGWPGTPPGTAPSGCARRAQAGRSPSQTPTGTQTSVARIISTTTRTRVIRPRPTASSTGPLQLQRLPTRRTRCTKPPRPPAAARTAMNTASPSRDVRPHHAPAAGRSPKLTGAVPPKASNAVTRGRLDTARSSRVRRSSLSTQGSSTSCADRQSRNGTWPTRPPAGGTATGRTPGSPPAWQG